MAITHGLRAQRVRITRLALVVTSVLGSVLSLDVVTPVSARASSYYACKSPGYACVIDGYNATSMNDNWAAKYYGEDTKGGIGTPPHNCTLYAAWMLAHNGLADPGHSWGYADQWGRALASQTNHTPAVGSIAWYEGGAMGHVAYVAQINWTNQTVFLGIGQLRRRRQRLHEQWLGPDRPTHGLHPPARPATVATLATKQRLPQRP